MRNDLLTEVAFDGLEEVIAHDGLNPEELAIAHQTHDQMMAMLKGHLSPRQFAVIEAYYFDGCSIEEMAIQMALTPSQVFHARHNALKKLRTLPQLRDIFR